MSRYRQLLERGQHYWRQGDVRRAVRAFDDAARAAPREADAPFFLGTLLCEQGHFERGLKSLNAAHQNAPGRADILINLGAACQRTGQLDAAATYLRAARERLQAPTAELDYNLGIVEQQRGHPLGAATAFAEAARLAPGWAAAWTSLAHNRMTVGHVAEARVAYDRALAADPDAPAAWSNRCWSANYDEKLSDAGLAALHREFGERFGATGATRAYMPPTAERITIGWLSPNLADHAVAYFVEPLFRHYDRRRFRFTAYTDAPADPVGRHLLSLIDAHTDSRSLSDADLRARIVADGVDILIDLAGHTAHNRLRILAPPIAPLQISAVGYPTTTGLAQVNALLTDATLDPADTFPYTEPLIRLPLFCCYQPPVDAPPPGPLPALKNGYLTFGSFQNFAKLSPETLARWGRLLRAIPDARLVLCAIGGGEAATRADLAGRFTAHGIDAVRLTIEPFAARADYLARHKDIDLCLDTTPWNGHTTTCHALWMGVPTLTRATGRRAGRMGLAVLGAVGLADSFAALNDDDFVARGLRAAADLNGLATLRGELRARVRASPLTDGVAYTTAVEGVLTDALARTRTTG